MEVKLSQAVKMFYSKSSFDMIYLEAVANALDAGATEVEIYFEALSVSDTKSFKLKISDNGVGFTDDRYNKFCTLMNVDEGDKTHRGLGRLVYLFYFDDVKVKSHFNKTKYREFTLDENLEGSSNDIKEVEEQVSGSIIEMSKYSPTRLRDGDFVDAYWVKKRILKKFYSRLYSLKQNETDFSISIKTSIARNITNTIINKDSLPEFNEMTFTSPFSFDGEMKMLYSIRECEPAESSVITALSIDERNESIDVYADESTPVGYNLVFVLFSDSFQGQTDATRQNISLSSADMSMVKRTFRNKIIEILNNEQPSIVARTKAIDKELNEMFPHLIDYFDCETIGISSRKVIVENAQKNFFRAQQDILTSSVLSDSEFDKALDMSGRALTEYILFRQKTIESLKGISTADRESKIHNLIVPQRTILRSEDKYINVYKNGSWILDEKFMTYSTVLSEQEMSDLLREIEEGEVQRDDDRPDIAIIFSDDPNTAEKVEVVIIELKKKGLKPEENVKVEVQLEKRARKLSHLYPDKIQRIWLFGVTELDNEYKSHLSTAGYHPLYSKGTVFINTTDITIDWNSQTKIPAVRQVMDFDALIDDADARNKAFLDIIKGKFND